MVFATSFLAPEKCDEEFEPDEPHPVTRPAAASSSARVRDAGTPPAYLVFLCDGRAARPPSCAARAPRAAARGAPERAAPAPVRGRRGRLRTRRLCRGQ